MKRILQYLLCLLIITLSHHAFSQDNDEEENKGLKFNYGGYVGGIFANSGTAAFYNGAGDNSIERVLQNQKIREEIMFEINHTYELGEVPQTMNYKFTNSIGFQVSVDIAKDLSLGLNMGYAKLQTVDQFKLNYTNLAIDHLTFDTYYLGTIMGEEKRYLIDLQLEKAFELSEQMSAFAGLAINMNNVIVTKSAIQIGELEYNIKTDYTNYISQDHITGPVYDIQQGAVGVGGMAYGGVKIHVNDYFSLDPGLRVYYSQNRLPGYNKLYLHFMPFIRFSFSAFVEKA
jgi:hypothetical protein